MVAHALAAIKNRKFAVMSTPNVSLYWRCTTMLQKAHRRSPYSGEILQFANRSGIKAIEKIAQQKLVDMVPEELRISLRR